MKEAPWWSLLCFCFLALSCAHSPAVRSDIAEAESADSAYFLACSSYSLRVYTEPTRSLSEAAHVADWLSNYAPTLPWQEVHHVDISWCDAWYALVFDGNFVARDVHQHFSDRAIVVESSSANPQPRSVALFAHAGGVRERVASEVLAVHQLALVFDREVAERPPESAREWRTHDFANDDGAWLLGGYHARERNQQSSADVGLLALMRWTNVGSFQLRRSAESGALLFSAQLHGDYPNTVADNLRSAWATIRVDALGSLLGLANSDWRVQEEPAVLSNSAVHGLRLELDMQEAHVVDGIRELFRP